jgi:hypothetical protein
MEWSPLRFRPGAEQSKNSDRHPQYGAQAYQQELAVTSIERQIGTEWDALAKYETWSKEADVENEIV